MPVVRLERGAESSGKGETFVLVSSNSLAEYRMIHSELQTDLEEGPTQSLCHVGCRLFHYLPELLLDFCMKCIQFLLDGILPLRRRLKLHLR